MVKCGMVDCGLVDFGVVDSEVSNQVVTHTRLYNDEPMEEELKIYCNQRTGSFNVQRMVIRCVSCSRERMESRR